ncbi:MAG TPA: class I tRNA ligase family protein [Thermoplasmata archaeon]|nr:class I tRNA ligase family protein [Thermoplasmata archaeon]
MELRLPDTLTGRRRPVPHLPGRGVTLYVCGPTVYDRAHVGHARTYLYFDIARRFLEAEGLRVRHVMNITDFEDKIDARARELGMSWRALAGREERRFLRDLRALGIRLPGRCPRASAFVPQMIRVGRQLERTGRVRAEGDEQIYSPPPRPPGTNFSTDRQLASHAVAEPGHPFPSTGAGVGEFMIWRRQGPPKPSWPSPWGRGVPGWHLECYAMAQRYLGLPVDLHGGAIDLIYPHHYAENEIALALRGTRFSRVFLHTGFVLLDGAKMSKSVGNLVPLRTALDQVGPGPLRWYLLGTPLSKRLAWDPRALARAQAEFRTVRRAVRSFVRAVPSGRGRSASVRALSEGIRRDLASGLAVERAYDRLRRWAARRPRGAGGRAAPGERSAARAALLDIQERTGLPLL